MQLFPSKSISIQAGFTLIELSIVLVIIGLIVGGVLVGQDLVSAAGARATITQIEKYNQAVNTFRGKYNVLPGDMDGVAAVNFGFAQRSGIAGQGNGDGIIQGVCGASCWSAVAVGQGETSAFWSDLTYANGLNINLIEGSYPLGITGLMALTSTPGPLPNITGSAIANYLPPAKIGRGNYIYIWCCGNLSTGSNNYFGISAISAIGTVNNWEVHSTPALTIKEAYSIDTKMDDGLPQSGRVTARYINYDLDTYFPAWAGGTSLGASQSGNAPTTNATIGSATTCYDNSTSADGQTAANGNPQHYSLEMNHGSGVNCALSFIFQ